MLFVTHVFIGQSFGDWFAHYSLAKIYNFEPVSAQKIHQTTCPAMQKFLLDQGNFCLQRTVVNTGMLNFIQINSL